MSYKYNDPSYEEVAHRDDPYLCVAPEKYDDFLEALHYGMKTAESFLRKQFAIEETVLHEELDRYREEMIEFTWLAVRDDPEWVFIEKYRAGILDAKLLPAKEGESFYDDIEYTLAECITVR